jgi:agmatinase
LTYQRDPLPAFAGIPTFLRAPMANSSELGPGAVAVLGVPHDATLGSRQGSRFGPRGIRNGSLDLISQLETAPSASLTNVSTGTRLRLDPNSALVDLGDVDIFPNSVERSSESMRQGAQEIAECGALPILLGGDHYVSFPLFSGWSRGMASRGQQRFGYIHYDNHLDLADDNRIWGKLWHGSQVRRISELPVIDPRNMVWIGAAGHHSREQAEWLRASGATLFTPTDIRTDGIEAITRRAVEIASHHTDSVYVSLDIDVVDGGASPGTGSVVMGGISPRELLISMEILGSSDDIAALDVAEVGPPLDPSDRTIRIAAGAILAFIAPKVLLIQPGSIEPGC